MAEDTPDPKDTPKDDKPDLGDAGKKALDAERKARRDAEAAAKKLADEIDELKGKDKGDLERLTEKLTAAEKRADTAEANVTRFEVAAAKGVKARWLTGTTREELEAAADEYLTDHPPATGGTAAAKPTEDLKGGGDPTEEPTQSDPRKLAETVPRL